MSDSQLAPWKPQRRWFALRLRTLMLLILPLAAGLGWKANRARIQTQAVARIEKAGGDVVYDYTFSGEYPHKLAAAPWAPAWLRRRIGDAYFQEVTFVSFFNMASDDGLAAVADLDRLIELRIYNTKVTGPGLVHLRGLNHLRDVVLVQTSITDAGLAHLARVPHLEKLHLDSSDGTGITDTGLAQVATMTRLRDLNVMGMGITDANLAHLKTLAELRSLNLSMTAVTGEGLAHLVGLKQLRTLDLSLGSMTDRGLEHLKGHTQLEELDLMSDSKVSDAGLVWLEGLKSLHKLNLSATLVTDAGLVHLAKLSGLQELNLSANEISDVGLTHLRGLHQLRDLNLDWTKVSAKGVATLAAAIPRLAVSHQKGPGLGPLPARYTPPPLPPMPPLAPPAPPLPVGDVADPADPLFPLEPPTPGTVVAVAPAPAPDGALLCSGRVLEKGTRAPVADATVTIRRLIAPDPERGGTRVLQETNQSTDAEGKYDFRVPPEQMAEPGLAVILHVEHPDYPPADDHHYGFGNVPQRVQLGDPPSFDVDLAAGTPVTGVVETPLGKPAAGVLVLSTSYSAAETKPGQMVTPTVGKTRTDDEGRFRLLMATPGEADVTIYPENYTVAKHKLKNDQRGDLGRFVLEQGIVLKGTVLDAGATPLAGVTVNVRRYFKLTLGQQIDFLYPWSGTDSPLSRFAVTDAKGAFAMAPLPPGLYQVMPVERDHDPARGETFRQLPAPFAPQNVTLNEDDMPPPLTLRALPHVTVLAQMHDSKGNPARGHTVMLYGGLEGDVFWAAHGWPDATGKIVILAPRGLNGAALALAGVAAHPEYSMRHRLGKDAPWRHSSHVKLASLDCDVKDTEIVVYESPTLLVNVADGDGSKPRGIRIEASYPEVVLSEDDKRLRSQGPRSDVRFTVQRDGRFRSQQLLPDEMVTVKASAVGYQPRSVSLKLPEGSIKELELVLDKP